MTTMKREVWMLEYRDATGWHLSTGHSFPSKEAAELFSRTLLPGHSLECRVVRYVPAPAGEGER